MGKLKGKTAIVTGGNSGIGLAIAEQYAKEGAKVAIFGRNEQKNNEAVQNIGENAIAISGDVSNFSDLDNLFNKVNEAFGKIDIIVANAGIPLVAPVFATTEEDYDKVFDVNVKGTFFTIQKAIPNLNKNASIILITSGSNEKGFPGLSAYAGTKAALRSFARTFSSELVEKGIRVNALSPGPIETPIFNKMGLSEEEIQNFGKQFEELVPLKRFGQPKEIATAAVFLGSDDSSYVVGTELVVDGGLTQV